jgi:hypothetical protein
MPGGRGKIRPQDGRPFKKNDPRINKKGRPPKLPDLDNLLIDVLGEKNKKGEEAALIVLKALRREAIAGNIRAAEVLLDRAYGKLKQSNDINLDFSKLSDGDLDIVISRILHTNEAARVRGFHKEDPA